MRTLLLVCAFVVSLAGSVLAQSSTTADRVLKQYLIIHDNLASDSTKGIAAPVSEITKISRQAAEHEPKSRTQLIALSVAAAKLNTADLKAARDGFGELSEKLIAYWKVSGAKTQPPYQLYCSMLKKNWLQMDKAPRNPYYGKEMPKCGELVQLGKTSEQTGEQSDDDQMDMGHHH